MSRQRLTDKVAADVVEDKGSGIDNDTAAMNNPEHEKNDPKREEYAKGEPSAWGEDVDKTNLWKKDKRDGMHVPEITAKSAAEAIQNVRKLENIATKAIIASQRILPGAERSVIETQASELMHLPEPMLDAMLGRQQDLANSIAKAAGEVVEAAKAEEAVPAEKKEEEVDAAAKCDQNAVEEGKAELPKDEKVAALMTKLAEMKEELEGLIGKKKDEKEAAKEDKGEADLPVPPPSKPQDVVEKEEEAEEKKEKKEEKAATEEVEASEMSLLDDIFSSVTASDNKKGAKSLEGLVKKQASESGSNPLDSLWSAPPDVSKHFQ